MATVVAASPPTDGMVLWLDATDASTVVDDQGQTAASGQFSGMVREWRDKSPNHFDAIQTDPASQPEYLPGVIHGRPSLRMDGLDFLSLEPVLSFGNAISIYTVIQLDDLSNRDDRDGIFSGADAFGVRGGAELWAGGDDGPVLGQIYVDRSFPSAFDDEGGIVLVLGASYDGANSIFALNGQSETVPYQLRGGGWADDKYMVGRSPFEGGGGLNGLMGELLVYDRCLDANERLLVEQYLTKKYSESQAGDADRDGDVDLEDLNLVRNHFGETGQNIPGDANGDGTVDLVDLNDVRNHFGAVAGGAAVAEPGAGSLLLWAITATYFLRRKWASVARFMP